MHPLPPLPRNWERRVDKRSGRLYFVDHDNCRTTWDDPRISSIRGTLPPGWEQRMDKRTNRTYFVNHVEQTTTWTDPRTQAQGSVNSRNAASSEQNSPDNWERKYDSRNQRCFYLDHNTKTTSWEPPNVRAAIVAMIDHGLQSYQIMPALCDCEYEVVQLNYTLKASKL